MASSDLLKSPKAAPVGLGFMSGSSEIEDVISESPELESEHNNFSSSTIGLSSTASDSTRQNTSTPQSSAGSYKEGDGFITVTSPSPEVEKEIKEEDEEDVIAEEDYGKVAQNLYDGVYDRLNADEYARWLGSEGTVQEHIRTAYMDLFEWSTLSILMALRDLCNRIYMKGESQQLNRVIESFSQAWVDKNRNHGFYDANVVYTIAYALILLNTDIYAADHTASKKMTKSAFVNNTMETIKGHMNAERQALQAAKTLPHTVSPKASFDESSTNNTTNQPTHRPKRSSISFSNSGNQQQHDTTSMVNECSCKPFTKEWEFQLEMILKVFYSSVSKEALKLHIVENSSGTPSSNIYGSQHQQQPQQAAVSTAPSLRSSIMGNGGGSILGRLNKFRGSNRNFENQSRLSTFGGLDRSGDSIRRDSLNSTFSFESNFSAFGGSRHAVGFAGLLWNSMIKEEGADESFGDFEKIEQELKKEVELELLGAPWTKEGLLKYRPYIDPNTGKKSKKKDWTQVFMVVQRGQLKMFNFDTSGNSKSNSGPVNGVVGAGNWMENAKLVDGFHLCHTMAQELPPPKKAKGFEALWSLTLPHRGLLVFQAGTAEIAKEFVYTCNYWAGRLSKEPFEEAVSSMEFGWGVPLERDNNDQQSQPNAVPQRSPRVVANRAPTPGDKLVIKEWRPTGHSLVVSDLDEDKQITSLNSYINRAEEMLTEHNALRGRISQSFTPGSQNWSRAHSNWEKKSQYLLQQVIRYKTYVENLERGAAEKKEKLAASEKENSTERKASIATETGAYNGNNDTDSSASVVTARYEDSSGNESSTNKQSTLETNLESDERDCPNLAPNDASYSPKWMNN